MAVVTPPRSSTTAPPRSERPPRRPPRRSFGNPGYRAGVRYLVFGRAFPTVLFGFMGWLQLNRVRGTLPPPSLTDALDATLPAALYLAFCAIPAFIYVTRPRPKAQDGSLAARAAAFGGTLLQLIVGVIAPDSRQLLSPPSWLGPISTVALVIAWAFAVWGLSTLRRSLSIIPEARSLVTRGPYRLIRHPLYLAEISAAVALTLTSMKIVPLVVLGGLITLQLVRMGFEERLLGRVFPEYAAYAARTRRLIPFVY